MPRPRRAAAFVLLAIIVLAAGCSHPAAWIGRPHLHADAGQLGPAEVSGYDTNDDRRIDYLQIHDARGVKRRLLFDTDGDGAFELEVEPAKLPEAETRTLLVLLDGISFHLVQELYAEGRFRLFEPPGRIVPAWPTVTDNIYADFFETPRPFGVEALYMDNDTRRMAGGHRFYLAGGNERTWPRHMLWRQSYWFDAIVYGLPDWVAGRELDYAVAAVVRWLDTSDEPYAAVYMVSSDALGHKMGHEHLKAYLHRVDEALEQLVWRSRGRLRIACLADHALNEQAMKRTPILQALREAGFRVRDRLEDDRDVAVPDYGLVSHVAVYTSQPAAAAAACAKAEGVDLAVYVEGGTYHVQSRDGLARVETRADGRHRYVPLGGDPLRLNSIVGEMKAAGRADADGWAALDAWLRATWDHDFPDPLVRIARSLEGNVVHPPQVLLSLAPEYYFGEDEFDAFATLRGTHGSLHKSATTTFVLSNFFEPPAVQRGTELRDFLKARLNLPTLLPPKRADTQ